jgi:hypothetical protein
MSYLYLDESRLISKNEARLLINNGYKRVKNIVGSVQLLTRYINNKDYRQDVETGYILLLATYFFIPTNEVIDKNVAKTKLNNGYKRINHIIGTVVQLKKYIQNPSDIIIEYNNTLYEMTRNNNLELGKIDRLVLDRIESFADFDNLQKLRPLSKLSEHLTREVMRKRPEYSIEYALETGNVNMAKEFEPSLLKSIKLFASKDKTIALRLVDQWLELWSNMGGINRCQKVLVYDYLLQGAVMGTDMDFINESKGKNTYHGNAQADALRAGNLEAYNVLRKFKPRRKSDVHKIGIAVGESGSQTIIDMADTFIDNSVNYGTSIMDGMVNKGCIHNLLNYIVQYGGGYCLKYVAYYYLSIGDIANFEDNIKLMLYRISKFEVFKFAKDDINVIKYLYNIQESIGDLFLIIDAQVSYFEQVQTKTPEVIDFIIQKSGNKYAQIFIEQNIVNNNLEAIKYIYKKYSPNVERNVVVKSIGEGNLKVSEYLIEVTGRDKYDITNGINKALKNGYLYVAKYLADKYNINL